MSWINRPGTRIKESPPCCAKACRRLQARWPNLISLHLPIHASWLNQIEIYFSVLKRKALVPDDFGCEKRSPVGASTSRPHYERIAQAFEWEFTRQELHRLLARCAAKRQTVRVAE